MYHMVLFVFGAIARSGPGPSHSWGF